MKQSTRIKLVKIGNSRGIRIPKAVIERLNLCDDVEMVVKEDHIELRPGRHPRDGWAEAFQQMAQRGDDQLMDESIPTKWDNEEWSW
jgi:antitoxin MazE